MYASILYEVRRLNVPLAGRGCHRNDGLVANLICRTFTMPRETPCFAVVRDQKWAVLLGFASKVVKRAKELGRTK